MCGIFCEICAQSENGVVPKDHKVMKLISNRGPNYVEKVTYNIRNKCTAIFCGSVLWMQGPSLTPQPFENDCGILLYNGDIFDETWDKTSSDTQIIMEKLNYYNKVHISERHQNIIETIKKLKGPFSLIYYDKINDKLYFTRDRIGRNSLLIHKNKTIVISSVLGRNYKAYEIPATHIYMLDVDTNALLSHSWSDGLEDTFELISWLEILERQQSLSDDQFQFTFDGHNFEYDSDIINNIDLIAEENTSKTEVMTKLLENEPINKVVKKLSYLLEKSVQLRLETQPQRCKECIDIEISSCNHCCVGILFSGGLDCTILAFLADKYLCKEQPIDLINVAFNRDLSKINYDVPDRLTGELSFEELKRVCPNRMWTFRKVDVPFKELEIAQQECIADLVYPRQTILDESLGSALWFASRANNGVDVSPCRVLILGSGADELFGGYTRHRNAYKRRGWHGLQKELTLDWKRISFRNLARDNRVICDHGRQPRMPYLDEDFTNYVVSLEPWFRCYPSENLGPGLGDKLMLRLIAFSYGLKDVAVFPKRALQFGSRIANKKEKGSDISKNFLT